MVIIEVYGAKVEKIIENPMLLSFFNLRSTKDLHGYERTGNAF